MIDRATRNHILDLKISEFDGIAGLLNLAGIVLGSVPAIEITLSTGNHHLTVLENQCSRPGGLLDTHDQSGESLGIVLGISAVVADF